MLSHSVPMKPHGSLFTFSYIILDTNIFESNWKFDDAEHKALLDYHDRTESILMMPQIVWDEIENRYRTRLKEGVDKLRPVLGHLNSAIIAPRGQEKAVSIPYVDIDAEVERYKAYLVSIFGVCEASLIPYPEKALAELARKAINRVKPFSSKGEEFRDGILWHCVLEKAREHISSSVVFISNNVREFTDLSNTSELHPTLRDEAKDVLEHGRLKYYPSLQAFIEDIARREADTSTAFVTEGWVAENINFEEIMRCVHKLLPENFERLRDMAIKGSPANKHELENMPSGALARVWIAKNNLISFNVYPFSSGDKAAFIHLFFPFEYVFHDFKTMYRVEYIAHLIVVCQLKNKALKIVEVGDFEPHFDSLKIVTMP